MKKNFLILVFFSLTSMTFGQLELRHLTVENVSNPIGIGVKTPLFSWKLVSGKRNVKQSAYEIQAKERKIPFGQLHFVKPLKN